MVLRRTKPVIAFYFVLPMASGPLPEIKLQMHGLLDGKVRWERRVENPGRLRFSPNGKLLVATTPNHVIHIYSASDGSELARSNGHNAMIYCLAFSPDGSRLASGSGDTTALVWDLRTALNAACE